MKKLVCFLLALIVVCMSACTGKNITASADQTSSTPEKTATITVDHADSSEANFAEDGANYDLVFSTNVAVKDFTLLEMDESEALQVSNTLWCLDELTPEKPVIVSTWLNDATISRGISYVDQNGEEHVFSIVLSMKDDSVSLVEFKEQKTLTIDEAFDAFLKGEIPAVNTDGKDRCIYDYYRIGDGQAGIGSYAFCDFTGDGVPEMLIAAVGKEILMYQDGKLVTIYESHTNGMNGPIDPLENGAMFEKWVTTGTFYFYTTFNADGTSEEIEFDLLEYPESEMEKNIYRIEGRKVTKQEFDELTKEIFAAAEKKAELDWIDWTAQ